MHEFISAKYLEHMREVEQKLQDLEELPTLIQTRIQDNYPNVRIVTTFAYEVVSKNKDPDYEEIPF